MNFGFQCDCDCGKCSWCCLKEVYAWGSGTTSADTTNQSRADAPLHGTRDPAVERQSAWIDFSTNGLSTWAIMQDGSLWGWGQGPLGDGSSTGKNYPVFIDNGPWVKVFAGSVTNSGLSGNFGQCYAIKQDGSLWGWGAGLPTWPTSFSTIQAIQIRARLSAPVVGAVITNGGNYTSTPSVSVVQQGGSGSVTSHASVVPRMKYSGGNVTVTAAGSGYLNPPVVEITAAGFDVAPPGFEVTPARYTVRTRHPVASVALTSGGSGYEFPPQVVFQFGGGSGAAGIAVIQNGVVVGVTITNPGANYGEFSPPIVRFEGGNPASAATGTATLGEGFVSSVSRADGGHYTHPISLRLSFGNASISFTQSGIVEGIEITNGGGGYTSATGDRPLLQFSHGAASGFCTLAPGGVHSATLRPASVTSIPPPISDDTTGTVPAGSFLLNTIRAEPTGMFFYDFIFDNISSAELIDGEDRRPLNTTAFPGPGGFTNHSASIPSNLTGWKNRPLVRIIAKNPDQSLQESGPENGSPAYQGGCVPSDIIDFDSLPKMLVPGDGSGFFIPPRQKVYAVQNAQTSQSSVEVRESHGRASAITTGTATPGVRSNSVDFIGIKTQIIQDAPWVAPVSRNIDFAVNPVNAYGCGAQIRAVVGDNGSISPLLVRPGCNYTEEPSCSLLNFVTTAFFPRQVDGSPGWSDVAISQNRSIGIKNGLLYHWTGLLGPPTRVGKRLELMVSPKDKHAVGGIAGRGVGMGPASAGLIVDFPQASGGAPFSPISFNGRYARPSTFRPVRSKSSDEKGNRLSEIYFFPSPRDEDFFPVYEGSMVLRANVGHGYLSMPSIEVSEFCDFEVEPQLIGPDQCTSVSSAAGLWALGDDGVLWEIGSNRIYFDAPPRIGFIDVTFKDTLTFEGVFLILVGNAPSFGVSYVAVYSYIKEDEATPFEAEGDYYARISSRGEGYRNASLQHTRKLTTYFQPVNASAFEATGSVGNVSCEVTSMPDPDTLGSLTQNVTGFYLTSGVFTSSVQPPVVFSESFTLDSSIPLGLWRGKVISRDLIKIGNDSTIGFQSQGQFFFGDVVEGGVSVSGTGTGASYELFRSPTKLFHIGSAATPNAVPDLRWQWISKLSTGSTSSLESGYSFYGKLQGGELMALARMQDTLTTLGGGSPLNFFPYPYLSAVSSHGRLVVSNSGKLYSMGSPIIGPEKTRGSIELLISSPGEGYTEPILAQFSSQPPGIAVADPQISGEVVAVGVTNSGSGWSSPPVVSISGSAQGQVIWGGPVESIAVTNGGSGYLVPPSVRFSSPGIPPDGVSAVISGGSVVSVSLSGSGGRFRQVPQVFFDPNPHLAAIEVTSGGSGYESSPSVLILGGGGSGAAARSELSGSVDPDSLALNSGGVGYQSEPQVVFTGGGGSGASASCQVSEQGVVQSITLTSPGSGYTSPPTIQFVGGGGNGAAATCGIKGSVARVIITSIGSGYESAPLVFFQGGNGSGSAAVAQMALSGSGAAATARIDGRVLSVRVTSAGSGYQSSPAVTFTGGQNFKASGQELLDSDFMPRAQARISGSISSVNIQQAGQNYMTGNIAAHDVNGESIQANPVQFVGPRESGPASPTGTATVFANSPPGSGIQSISVPLQDRKFASKPKAIFPNSWPIDCRTSLRIAGIAIKPKTTHPNSVFSSILKLSDGSISRSFASSSMGNVLPDAADANFVTFLSSPVPFGEANLQGSLIGSGGEVVRANIAAQFIRDFPFDTPPEVKFFCDTGTGASHSMPLDSDGFLAGDSFWISESVDSSGQNYGSFARCFLSGGVRKVIPPTAVAVLQGGVVVAVNIQSEGSGYSVPPIVVFSGGGGGGASGVANLTGGNGARRGVAGVALESGGGGYRFPPQVNFVFNEPTLPANSAVPRTVQLRNVSVEGVELVALPDFERMEVRDLQAFQNGFMFWFQGHPGNIGGNDPANRIDYYIFFEDGFLAGLSMPISSSDSSVFLKELQGGVSVQLSAPCKTPAVVTVVRPTWEIASQSSNSFAAKRLT